VTPADAGAKRLCERPRHAIGLGRSRCLPPATSSRAAATGTTPLCECAFYCAATATYTHRASSYDHITLGSRSPTWAKKTPAEQKTPVCAQLRKLTLGVIMCVRVYICIVPGRQRIFALRSWKNDILLGESGAESNRSGKACFEVGSQPFLI